jgi:archaellum component FlaF (FlaF/FlaG flagellin family)
VKLGDAFAQNEWIGTTPVRTVTLTAGWFGTDHGVATVTLSTRRVLTNGISVNDNNAISFGIDPTTGSWTLPVATVTVRIVGRESHYYRPKITKYV